MGRKPTPQPLTLADNSTPLDRVSVADTTPPQGEAAAQSLASASKSPTSLRSPRSPASSQTPRPLHAGKPTLHFGDEELEQTTPLHDNASASIDNQGHASSPASPFQPVMRHAATEYKKPTKTGFFHFSKTSRAANQLLNPNTQHQHEPPDRATSSGSDGAVAFSQQDPPSFHDASQKPSTPVPSRSDLSISSGDQESGTTTSSAKKTRQKTFGILGRGKTKLDNKENDSPPPVLQDNAFRDMINSKSTRNRSQDRTPNRDAVSGKNGSRERDHRHGPTSSKDTSALAFLSGLRSSSTRAADMISKGIFGKGSRSGNTIEKEAIIDDEHYTLKVINLPLVEQTRLTRISKRLENSRDKTEFWMPAFPWRAIDYLNYKGCDVEGLYRVPGSGPQIKKWQRRFDEQYDVNLFDAKDLYDINIIGSMLKAWLRELPDELLPKEAQDRIARECAGSTEVPQMLVDELSNLSPFNYYLLFAITCHLSLLLAHSEKNKMDFRNLCICFQPCMKIDAFCFKFLVCDWRDCWKGCKNEAKYIEEEYTQFDQPLPRRMSEPRPARQTDRYDERQLSSPSSVAHSASGQGNRTARSKKHGHQLSDSNASVGSNMSSVSTSLSNSVDRDTTEGSKDLRRLSPIKPLSPIGF
ncbi:hypothetical protein CDD81_3008 [Ophiocordyceps australis]|uniref:Rho-GAP domain-containing protein n=1 Tax=Ophiocordyceps australis TaxID=1399860 RepID=A0A2C5XCF4_9HYPO|nr:hypothetical protein CDD81_3008 [Ophiocordyceps australis]